MGKARQCALPFVVLSTIPVNGLLSLGRGVCKPLDVLFSFCLRSLTLLTPQLLVSGNFDDATQKRTRRMTRGRL